MKNLIKIGHTRYHFFSIFKMATVHNLGFSDFQLSMHRTNLYDDNDQMKFNKQFLQSKSIVSYTDGIFDLEIRIRMHRRDVPIV